MNQPQHHAIYALEAARNVFNRQFHSGMFLALTVLSTVIAAFSAVSFLDMLTVGSTLSVLEEIISFSYLDSLVWFLLCFTLFSTVNWSICAIGAWQLYTAKTEAEQTQGIKMFRIFPIYLVAEGIFTALGSVVIAAVCLTSPTRFGEDVTARALLPVIIGCIVLATLSIVFVTLPFGELVQYITSLKTTLGTGLSPYARLPFTKLLVYGVTTGVLSLWGLSLLSASEATVGFLTVIELLATPIFYILLPIFFRRLHTELRSI